MEPMYNILVCVGGKKELNRRLSLKKRHVNLGSLNNLGIVDFSLDQ